MRCKIVRDIQQRDASASPFFCLQRVLPGITRIIVRVSSAEAVDLSSAGWSASGRISTIVREYPVTSGFGVGVSGFGLLNRGRAAA